MRVHKYYTTEYKSSPANNGPIPEIYLDCFVPQDDSHYKAEGMDKFEVEDVREFIGVTDDEGKMLAVLITLWPNKKLDEGKLLDALKVGMYLDTAKNGNELWGKELDEAIQKYKNYALHID